MNYAQNCQLTKWLIHKMLNDNWQNDQLIYWWKTFEKNTIYNILVDKNTILPNNQWTKWPIDKMIIDKNDQLTNWFIDEKQLKNYQLTNIIWQKQHFTKQPMNKMTNRQNDYLTKMTNWQIDLLKKNIWKSYQ